MSTATIPIERVARSILYLRGQRVILDRDPDLPNSKDALVKHDAKIDAILDAIRQLMAPREKSRREIGFHVREKAPRYRARKHR